MLYVYTPLVSLAARVCLCVIEQEMREIKLKLVATMICNVQRRTSHDGCFLKAKTLVNLKVIFFFVCVCVNERRRGENSS